MYQGEKTTGGGSSPRMRGTHGPGILSHFIPGIIPADAGNTPQKLNSRGTERDHPRGCGEHTEPGCVEFVNQGSSPRMRGTQRPSSAALSTGRIIPADAGNTKPIKVQVVQKRDHPRGCGEHTLVSSAALLMAGSSPRMRGTHLEILAIPTIQ